MVGMIYTRDIQFWSETVVIITCNLRDGMVDLDYIRF